MLMLPAGTINPRWRKSYFVLKDKKLLFVKTVQDDLAKPDGVTDLTLGRGVRSKEECSKSVEWPDDVEKEQCFGVAVEDGTYYLVGREAEIVKYVHIGLLISFILNSQYKNTASVMVTRCT